MLALVRERLGTAVTWRIGTPLPSTPVHRPRCLGVRSNSSTSCSTAGKRITASRQARWHRWSITCTTSPRTMSSPSQPISLPGNPCNLPIQRRNQRSSARKRSTGGTPPTGPRIRQRIRRCDAQWRSIATSARAATPSRPFYPSALSLPVHHQFICPFRDLMHDVALAEVDDDVFSRFLWGLRRCR